MKKKYKVCTDLRCKKMTLQEHLELADNLVSMSPGERAELDRFIRTNRGYEVLGLINRVRGRRRH